ncbi:MAG: DUF2520 domain-containing protein [Balneolaceae bacterium]|nr:MAG: DUF2520 domain-containing protein [Balneolaceae bacterium]
MTQKPAITIIGTGSVGSVLQDFFEGEGYPMCSLWNSRGGKVYASEKAGLLSVSHSLPQKESEVGDWIFITIPDDQILKTSDQLAKLLVSWRDKCVIHCSGNLSSEVLGSLKKAGAKTVSMHPIQTFKKGDDRNRLKDIYVSLEGDEELMQMLIPVIQKMGAHPFVLTAGGKQSLHIAAVFASNYLVALMGSVEQILKQNDIENGLHILKPLVEQTLHNVFEKGVDEALTGPISRGDSETVRAHLEQLSSDPQLQALYKLLGMAAVDIAKTSGKAATGEIDIIEALLSSKTPG